MKATFNADDGEKVSFYWKVSSEENGDFLKLYIDNEYQEEISGDVDWEKKSYTLSGSGEHTLEWRYVKNSATSEGEDRGWVDGLVVGTDILYPTPDDNSEMLDSHLKFTESGDGGWFPEWAPGDDYYYDGDALRCNETVGDGKETRLQASVESDSSETVKFHWKVSSEANHDYLQFYIDDTLKDQISGEVDWHQKSYSVSSGIHTLKWVYVKDSSGESGEDCGWVDFVHWSGPSPQQDPSNFQTINYKHDLYGRRIEKKVDGFSTRYLYDGDQVIAEYDGNNNLLRKYIYGPGIDQPVCMIEEAESETYYYHYDALSSVVALSDSAGDTVQTYQYSVYGQVAVEDINHPNPYMFAGRRFDIEIGLYYNRTRYYNPFAGRFLQADPIGYDDGMNLYAYCTNNPVDLVDPSGTASFSFSEIPDGALKGMGMRCTVTDDDGNETIYDFCDVSAWIQWISDQDDIFTDKWMKEQAGWKLSGEDETTFWYLMAINELLGGAEGNGFDYGAMENAGVRIVTHKRLNAFGNPATESRTTFVNFDQDTDKIHWSQNIRWNDPAPRPDWFNMGLTYSSTLCLAHELQEAENHLDGADLNNNRAHSDWSHADAIRTENLLRRKIMSLQPKRYPTRIRGRYYRPGGNSLRIRGRPPWKK